MYRIEITQKHPGKALLSKNPKKDLITTTPENLRWYGKAARRLLDTRLETADLRQK